MSTDPRRSLGRLGERAAATHLEAAGYEIVDANYRTRYGEIDLVAVDSSHIVFCEVKTRVAGGRGGPAGPLDAIGSGKRRRLRFLAMQWLAARSPSPARPVRSQLRFDAIGVTVSPRGELVRLEHVEGAF